MFAREARVQGLKSRAAFKLLEVFLLISHIGTLTNVYRWTPNTGCLKEVKRW